MALLVPHVAVQGKAVIGMRGTQQDQRRQHLAGISHSTRLGNGPAKQVSPADRMEPQFSARRLMLQAGLLECEPCKLAAQSHRHVVSLAEALDRRCHRQRTSSRLWSQRLPA